MKPLFRILFLIPALTLLTPLFADLPARGQDMTMAPSHCAPGERVVFSCLTTSKGKVLSVCASPDLFSENPWLQYRFGRPDDVEMAYPEDPATSLEAFSLETYTRPMVSLIGLHFSRKGVGYTVFDDYYAEDGAEEREAGVKVTLEDGREVVIHCKPEWSSSLFDLTDVVPPAEQ